jgi:1-acyl-sn-glycerol-3-phosphate acyltransferase
MRNAIGRILQILFFLLFLRPIVIFLMGVCMRTDHKLPGAGPAILVANHNSHLDTAVLMTLFPLGYLRDVRPLGAEEYFFRGRLMSWFSRTIMGIVPVSRTRKDLTATDRLRGAIEALRNKQIVIMFPEGSRGEPGVLGRFKSGVNLLAAEFPDCPVVPIYLGGLEKALPKGEALFVPFQCDIFVGAPFTWRQSGDSMAAHLEETIRAFSQK